MSCDRRCYDEQSATFNDDECSICDGRDAGARSVKFRSAAFDIDVLRRIAERGLKLAQAKNPEFIDLFQHMLDEIARARA